MARSAGRRIGNHRAVAWRWAAAMALLLGLLGCWLPAAREARATDLTLALNIEGQGLALTQAGIGLAGWDGTARTLTVGRTDRCRAPLLGRA